MKGRQKVVFGFAVLTSGIFCVALAMGKFAPPPEEIATPQTVSIGASVNVATNIKSEPRVIHVRSEEYESDLEKAESLASSCVLHLLDTTSPLPTVNFQ
jgi:hypothetical protein